MPAACFSLGNPQNPALVFLHGFLGSGQSWLEIARPFSGDYFCILPDLPGHGANTALDINAPLDFEFTSAWLARLLDETGAQKTHLLGYSLGGRAALAFACRHPGRVLSLTLESASPGLPDAGERAGRLLEDSARAAAILKDGLPAFVETWYRLPLFASLAAHPQKLALIKAGAARNDPRWMAKAIRELSPGLQIPLWGSLPRLALPVLLLAGQLDEKYAQVTAKMAGGIPNARRVVVPGAGHNIHLEQPGIYTALLRDFLDF